jgi:hypothetical protein
LLCFLALTILFKIREDLKIGLSDLTDGDVKIKEDDK